MRIECTGNTRETPWVSFNSAIGHCRGLEGGQYIAISACWKSSLGVVEQLGSWQRYFSSFLCRCEMAAVKYMGFNVWVEYNSHNFHTALLFWPTALLTWLLVMVVIIIMYETDWWFQHLWLKWAVSPRGSLSAEWRNEWWPSVDLGGLGGWSFGRWRWPALDLK